MSTTAERFFVLRNFFASAQFLSCISNSWFLSMLIAMKAIPLYPASATYRDRIVFESICAMAMARSGVLQCSNLKSSNVPVDNS